ncbi:MAG TPA: DUF5317 family protein [Clostridia bacterium]|nr:DUF5317 family protein [Clostridia bacterium]
MIFIYSFFGSIVIGYLLGGRFANYLHLPLRGLIFPILSFAIEAFSPMFERLAPWPAQSWLWASVSAQYILSFYFIFLNRSRKPVRLMAIGTALNILIIAWYGFRMPVTPMVYQHAGLVHFATRIETGELFEYILVNWDAPLWWLGDTIPILVGPQGLASIGDFLMAAGMGWLMVQIMRQKPQQDASQAGAPEKLPTKDGHSIQ